MVKSTHGAMNRSVVVLEPRYSGSYDGVREEVIFDGKLPFTVCHLSHSLT
jgi:hypothetical protein